MKTTKLFLIFILLSFVFTTLFAQVEENPKVDDKTEINGTKSIEAVGDKIEFKNETTNSILTITDEGSNAGSILLSPGSALTDPNDDDKLYNVGGTLHWNGSAVGTAGSAGGWTDNGGIIYNTTLTDRVGIGTNNPQSKLSVGGEGISHAAISALATSAFTRAVYGKANADAPSVSYGGFFETSSVAGRGVYGRSTGIDGRAIYGYASSNNGVGIYGEAIGTNAYAGYFVGRAYFNGNVGIGDETPPYKLQVVSTAFGAAVAEFVNTTSNGDGIRIKIGPNTNPTITNDYLFFLDGDATAIGSVEGNGSGGVSYNTTSDARLKMNIKEYTNALNVLSSIGIKKYERISNAGIEEIGVIAQELQKVYPQAVSGSPDSDVKTDPMMVDYSKLTPLLVKAVQEQQETIKMQESSIKTQDERIKELEKQNEKYRMQNSEFSSQNKNLENRLSKIESLLEGKRFTSLGK